MSYSCQFCDKQFKRAKTLDSHLLTFHVAEMLTTERNSDDDSSDDIEIITAYQCPKCEDIFTSKSKLKTHKKVHAKENKTDSEKHKCIFCDACFTSKRKLIAHKKDHKELLKCKHCEETLQTLLELTKHMKTIHCVQLCYVC